MAESYFERNVDNETVSEITGIPLPDLLHYKNNYMDITALNQRLKARTNKINSEFNISNK